MTILRVFPTRTSYTPTDEGVRIGQPDLLPLPEYIKQVHVSCCFTWERENGFLGFLGHNTYPHPRLASRPTSPSVPGTVTDYAPRA